jgi:tetratricopeptide (TPR) repeat protein
MLQVPGAPESLRELYVTTLARLGRFDEMSAQLDRLAPGAAADENAIARYLNLLIEAGWALRDAGRDAEAEALFRRALALDPSSASARQVLLHLYGSAEERAAHETAVAERRALEEDPQALYEEGSQLLAAGDPATARDLLARAAPGLEGTRFAEAAWYNLGLAAFKLEQWPAAAEAFGEAVRLHPTRADAQFQLGYALHRAERCAEAIAPLEAALELAPGRNETHYFLAACHSALGDAAAAARESELYRRGKSGG